MATKRKLVIVESPVKARTIKKFLGQNYIVESCMGHVRDLPASSKDIPEKYKKKKWAHFGVNIDENFEPIYCIPKTKAKIVKTLKEKLDRVDELILATDEDREGESISWHLVEILKPKTSVYRMVFHEITKEAIEDSLKHFRKIDINLVRAQEARRILDRLVGYSLSPLIWKKIAYGLSGGRVQSVAVRLLAEREEERLNFKKSTYWNLLADCSKAGNKFESRLVKYKDQKIAVGKDFDKTTGALHKDSSVLLLNEDLAQKLKKELVNKKWKVTAVESKPITRKPPPPFITSTLQQEANKKLGFPTRRTMQVAQKLYEKGLITYMRTDSTSLAKGAVDSIRHEISSIYGKDYLPQNPRIYSGKKVKGAQEAHEAIRPAGTTMKSAKELGLQSDEYKLYELIWMRTMASQMEDSKQLQTRVKIEVGDAEFGCSGLTVIFPGYLKAYRDDEEDDSEFGKPLPSLNVEDQLKLENLETTVHETKPPARYTEASLVQMMEKEGIGRPSTYSVVISTIMDRGYAKKSGNALIPTFTALAVTKLLKEHLPRYVDLGFTSEMETKLDEIAQGDLEWTGYLKGIYFGKEGLKNQIEAQEKKISPEKARLLTLPGLESLKIRIGRFGAYVCRMETKEEVCASLPDSCAPGDMTLEIAHKLIDQKINGADSLGKDPITGLPVYVLTGRYGPYVQLGDVQGGNEKVKRASIPPQLPMEQVTFDKALFLLSLPRELGVHPQSHHPIKAGLGRFGPYVVCDGDYRSIPKSLDLFEITFEQALTLLMEPKRKRGEKRVIKELGAHPLNKEMIKVLDGKYGPYLNVGKINHSLPENLDPQTLTLEQALSLLEQKLSGIKVENSLKKSVIKKKTEKKRNAVTGLSAIKRKPSLSKAKNKKKKKTKKKKISEPNREAAHN